MSERDAAYRRVFHHPQMLRDLLACVLDADWLRDLDWAGLREVTHPQIRSIARYPGSAHPHRQRFRAGDLVSEFRRRRFHRAGVCSVVPQHPPM